MHGQLRRTRNDQLERRVRFEVPAVFFRQRVARRHGLFDVVGDATDKGLACGGALFRARCHEVYPAVHVSSGDRPQCQSRIGVSAGTGDGCGQQRDTQVFAHEVGDLIDTRHFESHSPRHVGEAAVGFVSQTVARGKSMNGNAASAVIDTDDFL